MSAAANPLGRPMEDLVGHAAGRATDDLPPDVAARVAELARAIEAACAGLPPAPLTVLIFHLQLTEDSRRIAYADMAPADQGATDYRPVLAHAFAMARGFNPDCRILFVTGMTDSVDFVPADAVVVRLPLAPQALMYERVVAMAAYVQSAVFDADTVFLDSDAFANRPLGPVFRLPFDVAVTWRNDPGLMKINEGVIFAACRPGRGARAVFRRYLATYEALCTDPLVTATYGDIRRWRGGQLSLSAICHVPGVIDDTDSRRIGDAVVRYLPCDAFNFMIRGGTEYPLPLLHRKFVVHLKGLQKQSLPGLAGVQRILLRERMG